MRPWEMHRLTMRELDLIAAPDDVDDEQDYGDDVSLEPPVPKALRGL